MSEEVIRISDAVDLVPTASFKYAKWAFEFFNPVQSRLVDVYESDANVVIAAATSAGKTVCSEMFLSYEIRENGGRGIYVGPLKSLANEKVEEWSDEQYHFGDLKKAILTGDFRYTQSRVEEIDSAHLVIMTPEMLASRTRNSTSDKSAFLKKISIIVIDESHLVGVPGRGDHLEVSLMKLLKINPAMRIVFLSATMPNVSEICAWLSKLTKRDTFFLESSYRPCPLTIHYETYYDGSKQYDEREGEKVNSACSIVEAYPDDKFLIFSHTKRTGQKMIEALKGIGVEAYFHNADLSFKERKKIEDRFKNDSKLKVIVATSTLAWGVNLPARRVIILGVHRGSDIVPIYDFLQMIGRAGRPKYDPQGNAYILVPESTKKEWIEYLKTKPPIKSTLLQFVGTKENPIYKTLAFHIVSEIHQGTITTKQGFHEWFHRTLAHFQNDKCLDDAVIDSTIRSLEMCRAIMTENGEYQCTSIGKVASMFYFSPFDVADLRRNFKLMFEQNREKDDYSVALALGNIDSFRYGIVNKNEREQMFQFQTKIEKVYGAATFTPAVIKNAFAYYMLLKGKRNIPAYNTLQTTLLMDFDRTMMVLGAVDQMSAKWNRKDWFRTLKLRLNYGVGEDLAGLCQIPNIGGVRAKRLKDNKIATLDDFLACDPGKLATIMKCSPKLVGEAITGARDAQVKDSLDF